MGHVAQATFSPFLAANLGPPLLTCLKTFCRKDYFLYSWPFFPPLPFLGRWHYMHAKEKEVGGKRKKRKRERERWEKGERHRS